MGCIHERPEWPTFQWDIAKLADILGHSSIETTRIYLLTTGAEHLRRLERLGLLC